MSPEAQRRVKDETNRMMAEMALQELRAMRHMTQERLAQVLNVGQAAISKLERRTDMYVSTLADFVRAMGGRLEIWAHFPDGDVRIKQSKDLGKEATTGA